MKGVRWLCASVAALSVACSSDVPAVHATIWPEADALFRRDLRWIGGDGAYSVDLGGDRILWLFGDSFIASTRRRVRSESVMVRNSVAIQTGRDPSRAWMQFYWHEQEGRPVSFVAEQGLVWHWPAHGIRLDDTLLLFFERVVAPPDDPDGFEGAGWTAFRVLTPDEAPSDWKLVPVSLPSPHSDLQLGESVLREGENLVVYATGGDRHRVYVARYSVHDARIGDLSQPAWWTGDDWVEDGRYRLLPRRDAVGCVGGYRGSDLRRDDVRGGSDGCESCGVSDAVGRGRHCIAVASLDKRSLSGLSHLRTCITIQDILLPSACWGAS